ncbi:hypothetical protein SDJN02_12425 [Cucurbita argyrosperma subsp. argyrosperma]|nr:hypothetical protein SDJN02_12425 [Cucurbita argyrosperma subsp. argyrosperma]
MAFTCSSCSCSSLNFCLLKSGLSVSVRPSSRIRMLKPSKFPLKKCLPLQIRSSINNKIFEDQSEGVICYTDENGEIVCEGYDEGPRLHQNHLEKGNHHRSTRTTNLIMV